MPPCSTRVHLALEEERKSIIFKGLDTKGGGVGWALGAECGWVAPWESSVWRFMLPFETSESAGAPTQGNSPPFLQGMLDFPPRAIFPCSCRG